MGANNSSKDDFTDPQFTTSQNIGSGGNASTDYVTLTQDHFSRHTATESLQNTNPLPYELSSKQSSKVENVTVAPPQEPLSPKTVYEDIPFKLNPVLEMNFRGNGLQHSLVPLQRPNIGAYYYDFSLERSTLKDTA